MWSRTYGGTGDDIAYSLVATSDGGYAIAGHAQSTPYQYDFWLVKTDALGNMEWNRTYGGPGTENAFSLVATSDGGYAMVGSTRSFNAEYRDFYLVKTDSNGVVEWNRTYARAVDNVANLLVATTDGGYALAGSTLSNLTRNLWFVKTDSRGNMQWNKTYEADGANSLVVTSDGGYAFLGTRLTSGANYDFWLARTDSFGNMQWNRTYGGKGNESASSLVLASDGGYAIAGAWNMTNVYLGEGISDIWLVKTNPSGIMEWNRTYGEGNAHSLVAASDGGYALTGRTINSSQSVCWLLKTDAFGNTQWKTHYERGIGYWMDTKSLVVMPDGGYTIAGYIYYLIDSNFDFWLVKTDEFGVIPEFSSCLVSILVLTTTTFIIINKKRILPKR